MLTETPVYDAAYFIKKFEAIPDPLWYGGGSFYKPGDPKCRCAYGHCGQLQPDDRTQEAIELYKLEDKTLLDGTAPFLVQVNDGYTRKYPQPTPKQRVLAWLRDAQKAGL